MMETTDVSLNNSNLESADGNPNVLVLIRQDEPVTLLVNKLNNGYVRNDGSTHSMSLAVPSGDSNHGVTLINSGSENFENPNWKKPEVENSFGSDHVPQTDVFMCGICGHTSFKVLDYLEHKAQHAGPRAGICCELCSISYTRQVTLTEHYRLKHKVVLSRNKGFTNNSEQKQRKKPIKITEDIVGDSSNSINPPIEKNEADHSSKNLDTSKHIDSSQQDISCFSSPSTQVNENQNNDNSVKIDNIQSNFDLGVEQGDKLPSVEDGHKEFLTRDTTTETYVNVEIDPNFNIQSKENVNFSTNLNENNSVDKNKDFHFILLSPNSNLCGVQFKCLHCEYKTHWKSYMCKHMKEQHSDTLSIHQAIAVLNPHPETDHKLMRMSDFTAMQTKLRAESSKKRYRGIEKQDLLGTYPCPNCDKIFTRLRYLRKHLQTHRTEQKFLCDECGKAFKTQSYLNAHHKIHKKMAYSCSQCDFTSSVNSAIHAHRQIHNEGSVICDVCGYAYIDKSTLMKHKRVHDPDRPYACTFPGCTWRFKTEVMCKAHFKKHTTEGKFKCSKCGYAFRHKHHLRRHETKVHNTQTAKSKDVEEPLIISKQTNESEEIQNTVNLIVDQEIDGDQFELQNALQNSQLVIATDEEGNTINYEVTDIAMNVAYQTLLQGSDVGDTHTILIPQTECSQIVLHESETSNVMESD